MTNPINRREALRIVGIAGTGALGGALLPGALELPPAQASNVAAEQAREEVAGAFFTPHELRTVRVLVDDIIPRDEHSGSATDAKVPEFMEAMLLDAEVTTPLTKIEMRGGLAWLDHEFRSRFDRAYADGTMKQRHQLLDDIAFPSKGRPEMRYGADFFAKIRDFTASGFFSSAIGHKDLGYAGAVFAHWKGCPDAVMNKLGLSYAEFDARYGEKGQGKRAEGN